MNNGSASQPSKRYHRQKLILSLVSTALGWTYLLVLVLTPLAAWLVGATQVGGHPYFHFLLFSLAAGVLAQSFALPLSFTSGYWIEHRYGLSNQTLGAWSWERLKGALVGAMITLPLALVFYYCLRRFGVGWWLPVGGALFLFSVVLGRLAPVLIFPLFYRFESLPADHPLTGRIRELAQSVGLAVEGIYRFNLSKTTKKANAAFTGLGRAKRVLLADTLLDNFTDDEILAVVAHELGHFRLGHIWTGMAQGTAITFIGMYLVARLHGGLSGGEVTNLTTLPWLALLMGVYGFVTGPLSNAISRRHEFAADRYSAELMGDGAALAAGLDRLAELNLADRDPHPAVEFLFHSHPSIKRRVAALVEGRASV
ncbi:MAG: M48 family metallopeptidase [Candidatus Marinimicrobia bacterium]|nr:M48 family metallopeptidase [Candidatus Neomarinimicrobiota bacterium]